MPMGLSLASAMMLGGGGASWAPANLGASLYAFWDAEVAGSITASSGAVSSWVDRTSNAYALANAGATSAKPVYSATSFNGRPGLTLTKANSQFLQMTGIGSLPSSADPCEIWIIMDQTALPADTAIMCLFEYGNSTNAFRRAERTVSGGVNRGGGRIGTGAAATALSNANVDFSGRHALRLRIGATASQADIDGTAGASSSITPATSSGNIIVGRAQSGSAPMDGVINAILVTGALTGADETAMLAWAAARVA